MFWNRSANQAFRELATGGVDDGLAALGDLGGKWSKRRATYARQRIAGYTTALAKWLDQSVEESNFTYDLHPVNYKHLAAFVATVADIPIPQAETYVRELRSDPDLLKHYGERRKHTALKSDPRPMWGRRMGWYALTRALKPRLVVETGVHYGLGALAFTSALMRNAAEGRPGRYIGLEILPEFGWLLAGPYAEFGEIRYGKSLDLLPGIEGQVDLFLHDSDHSLEHELAELRQVAGHMSPDGLLLSDNSHATSALCEFAVETGRRFLHFQEMAVGHYPGAGIGAAWPRRAGEAAS